MPQMGRMRFFLYLRQVTRYVYMSRGKVYIEIVYYFSIHEIDI